MPLRLNMRSTGALVAEKLGIRHDVVFPFHFANISKTTCNRNLIFTFNED